MLAAAVIAVVVVAPGDDGGAGTPTLAQVDAAARARPEAPAPELAGGQPPVLDASVGELTFPDWEKKFGWRATGARTDQIEGRTVKTVFYRNPKGARLGYAVVDGDTLAGWNGGQRVTRAREELQGLPQRGPHRRHLDPAGQGVRDRRLRDRSRVAAGGPGRVAQHLGHRS